MALAFTVEGLYDSVSEDRRIHLERVETGVEIRTRRISDNQQLALITIPLADMSVFLRLCAATLTV
jgi:hypothetical protein